jgi:hypothetical protein
MQTRRDLLKQGLGIAAAHALSRILSADVPTTPGFGQSNGTVQVRILDHDRKTITPARINIIGSDNAFYEPNPATNPLADYSLKRTGNRSNVGPLRYQGSFFYTDGTFEISLPPGIAKVEVSKGYRYYRSVAEVEIVSDRTNSVDIILRPFIHDSPSGWHSVDPHLHFDRGRIGNDHIITQLLAAEGVDFGYIMTERSADGYGTTSIFEDSGVSIVSGYEVVNSALGHVNLIMVESEIPAVQNIGPIPPELSARPTELPLAEIYEQAQAAGGVTQHNHGGYGEEILSDVVLGKSDWVELLQFGAYRPRIGLEGYYLLLNSGFRYPVAGGSDYPVCRTLSDSITFVPASNLRSSIGNFMRGEAFATSGPLLFLSVNGKGPGSELVFPGGSPRAVDVRALAVAADLPFNVVEIIQDGKIVAEWHGADPKFRRELYVKLRLSSSSWIAARCSGPSTAHAHTNPVWIYLDGRVPFQPEAARQLLEKLRRFAPVEIRPETTRILEAARNKVQQMLAQGVSSGDSQAPRRSRFDAAPSNTAIFPTILPKAPARLLTIQGTVVDSIGQPIPDVDVSVCGLEPQSQTDAAGRFVLRRLRSDLPLFLRASKRGYTTANTSYLNPLSRNKLRILLPDNKTIEQLMQEWPGWRSRANSSDEATPGIVLLSIVKPGGQLTGLRLTTSPATLADQKSPHTEFRYLDAFGTLSTEVPNSCSRGLFQIVGVTEIKLQEAFPAHTSIHEPNLIVSVAPIGKDIVLPVFPHQISYASLAV